MTAQDIKEKTFEKAVFGGYDMTGVDDFLEEVAEGFTAQQKENAVLKGKLKVLAEKIEEYRSTEDAMRLALLSAQKLSVQIENEAKEHAQKLNAETDRTCAEKLASANAEAERIINDAKNTVAGEKAKIDAAKQATANFIARVRGVCDRQLSFLDSLADMKLPPAEPEPESESESNIRDTVKTIETSVAKMAEEPVDEDPIIDIGPAREAETGDEPTRLYTAPAPETENGDDTFDFDALSFDD